MKRLILILILTLSFQALSKADDINDFEIEGMSIGSSLLDNYSENEIKIKIKDNNAFYYKNNIFLDIYFELENSNYEWVQITIKPKDKNYLIYSIGGQLDYIDNISKCYKDMDNIFLDVKKKFKPNNFKRNIKITHTYDKTGNSKATYSRMYFDNGAINVECYDWSEEIQLIDKLLVSVMSLEFREFINNEAYK